MNKPTSFVPVEEAPPCTTHSDSTFSCPPSEAFNGKPVVNTPITNRQMKPVPVVEPTEWLKQDWQPMFFVRRFGAVFALSLLFGLILPGFIEYQCGQFYSKDVQKHLKGHVRTEMEAFDARQMALKWHITQIDKQISQSPVSGSSATVAAQLMETRARLQGAYDSAKPPYSVDPFYFGSTMLLWPIIYTCLGCLIFVLPPCQPSRTWSSVTPRQTMLLATALCILYRWPTWMRNTSIGRVDRRVFAAANFDMSPIAFITQEFNGLVICILLAVLWQQWSSFFSIRREELVAEQDNNAKDPVSSIFTFGNVERLSITFLHWQVSSVVLAMAFSVYTQFFWRYVVGYGDRRYLIPALIVHLLWGVTWALMSAPLLLTWYTWQSTRLRAVGELARRIPRHGAQVEPTLKSLQELQPIGVWNLAASGLVAFVSFLWPVLQSVLK